MGKALIITEKPSVADDIAKALGGFKKTKDYYESQDYLLSWAVGHLFELAVPAELKAQDKWALDKLPLMPERFDLEPVEKMDGRVKVLCRLLKDKNVTEVINACDAGREGELIFRYIIQYAGCTKPIRRLWLQSMTPEAIREGFRHLRTDAEMQPLAQAARSRNEADWLVGINATRAFTLRLRGGRGSTVTSLGRVQTPTLAIIVEREQKIKEFKPRAFHELHATFRAAAGTYPGRWFDEQFSKEESEQDRTRRLMRRLGLDAPQPPMASAQPRLDASALIAQLDPAHGSLWDEHRQAARLWQGQLAEALRAKCQGKPGVVELEEKKPVTQAPPQLYDLTTLQREANNRYGFSAQRTLQLAQALYERHKAITYPRTDSRCLPEDYQATVKATLKSLEITALGPFARKVLDQGWVRPNKRVFNDAKVGDHFAIIPTGNVPSALNRDEQALFDLVAKRFIAVFYPPAEYENTTRITRVEGEPFKTEGKILLVPGWLEVYGREAAGADEETLPPVSRGEQVATEQVEIRTEQTKPPPRYTEATILSAMEGAGRLVEDEELREAMKEKGLGTPATRAAIIETLIGAHYLTRHGKELQPTAKAIQTIALLKTAVPELTSPEMTGEWEFRLRQIEQKKLSRDEFMRDIRSLTAAIVAKAKQMKLDAHLAASEPFGQCPKCNQPLRERLKSFACTNTACGFSLWKTVAGRLLSREEVLTLLRERQIGPLQGFRSRQGKSFAARLKLTDQFKVVFDFDNGQAQAAESSTTRPPAPAEPVGQCPKCQARLLENGSSYICENAIGPTKTCDFRLGRTILQQPIDRAQLTKLLTTGKTDLLDKFVSKNGRRFKAYLVLKPDKTVGFEFEQRQREARPATKPKAPPAKIDFSGQEPVGVCPRCKGRIFETDTHYVCEKTQAAAKPCKFQVGKTILQQPLSREQLAKLLATGKTDLLTGFVSKRGTPFAAWLVLDKQGKVGFEFPPREGQAQKPSGQA